MIKVRITAEAVTDLFTPGVCNILECVKGLPRDVKLVHVQFEDDIVLYLFEDGKMDTTDILIKYTCPINKLKIGG